MACASATCSKCSVHEASLRTWSAGSERSVRRKPRSWPHCFTCLPICLVEERLVASDRVSGQRCAPDQLQLAEIGKPCGRHDPPRFREVRYACRFDAFSVATVRTTPQEAVAANPLHHRDGRNMDLMMGQVRAHHESTSGRPLGPRQLSALASNIAHSLSG
jgi:hypothetical protein